MKELKLAILIMAHRLPEQVALLCKCLVHNDIDIYIHIDKKVNDSSFKKIIHTPNTYFIQNRTTTEWGAFSIVDTIINCYIEIMDSNKYDYICNISGQDFPIKTMTQLLNYIKENYSSEFIENKPYSLDDSWWQENESRIKKYSFINLKFKGKYKIEKLINAITPIRKPPNNIVFSGNSGWFCLSNEAISFVISSYKHNKDLNLYFKFVWGADEIYFSTILYNSTFKDKLIGNLLHTEWLPSDKLHPKVFTAKDKIQLQQSNKFFARKFDHTIDKEIIDFVQTLFTK
jgi:hypothetical protein